MLWIFHSRRYERLKALEVQKHLTLSQLVSNKVMKAHDLSTTGLWPLSPIKFQPQVFQLPSDYSGFMLIHSPMTVHCQCILNHQRFPFEVYREESLPTSCSDWRFKTKGVVQQIMMYFHKFQSLLLFDLSDSLVFYLLGVLF